MKFGKNFKIFPSKYLGQNFLINKGIVEKIIAAAELSKEDTVLEVGPGTGVLTEELIKHAGRVIAVEKDKKLYELLKEKFKDAKNLELINADILKFEFKEGPRQARAIFPERSKAESRGYIMNFKLVANIPYNITGAFFRKFLTPSSSSLCNQGEVRWGKHGIIPPLTPPLNTRGEKNADDRPRMIVVMVQKEVGERLLGKNKSILSLAASLYGRAEKVCDVSPGSFNPPPKVTSMVVKLISQPYLSSPTPVGQYSGIQISKEMERRVMQIAKIGFSSRRKKLVSNLSTGLKISKEKLLDIFGKIGLGENVRAEELDKDDWLKLAKLI